MKKLFLFSSLLAGLTASAFADTAAEQSYVAKYQGRTDIPRPVSVVSPTVVRPCSVDLRFSVAPDGSVRGVEIIKADDYSGSDRILSAVRAWRFQPAAGQDKDVAVVLTIDVEA